MSQKYTLGAVVIGKVTENYLQEKIEKLSKDKVTYMERMKKNEEIYNERQSAYHFMLDSSALQNKRLRNEKRELESTIKKLKKKLRRINGKHGSLYIRKSYRRAKRAI